MSRRLIIPLLLSVLVVGVSEDALAMHKQDLIEAISVMQITGMKPDDSAQLGRAGQQRRGDAGRPASENESRQTTGEISAKTDRTTSPGIARVEVLDAQFSLNITQCQIGAAGSREFRIYARQTPGQSGGELWIAGSAQNSKNRVLFSTDKPRRFWESDHARFDFDGHSLHWRGQASGLDGAAELEFELDCDVTSAAGPEDAAGL